MVVPRLPLLWRRRPPVSPAAAVAAGACAVWTPLAVAAAADGSRMWPVVAGAPAAAALLLLFVWRGATPAWLNVIAVWTSLVGAAILGSAAVAANPAVGLAPAVLAIAGGLASRWPVLCYAAAFGLAGAWSSLEVYTGAPVSYIVDLLLAGLWTSLIWGWLTSGRRPSRLLAAGTVLVGVYLAYTLVSVLATEPLIRGVFGFRVLMWYLAAAVLVPLVIHGETRREQAFQAVLVLGSLLAAYAMFRWVTGPGGKEAEAVRLSGGGYAETLEGELRLFGAMQRPQLLGAWCSVMIPFGMVAVLSPMAMRWRVLGAALTGMCGLALVISDTRIAMAGVGVAMVSVLALMGMARGLSGRRGPAVIVGVLLVVLGVGTVATVRLNATDSTKERFEGLLNPTEDPSFQERRVKWASILAEVEGRPLGFGVGSSGEAQRRYGRYLTAVSTTPDSTYVKLIYEQGIVGLALFVAGLVGLLVTLVTRVVRSPNPASARLAAASTGALLAFCVAMAAAEYAEGLHALAPWLLVGLGLVPGDGD